MSDETRSTTGDPGGRTTTPTGAAPLPTGFDQALAALALAACAGLLIYKAVLIYRLNVNWDEFHFLSHVHALARGELSLLLLGAYTHLFSWLPMLPGDEMQQIAAARWVMLVLLAVTAWLIWRLARLWLTGFAALVPAYVYLSATPVMTHGASFRFDSMLAPASLAALLLLIGPNRARWKDLAAGLVLGVAFAVTIKVVLFLPLFAAAVYFRPSSPSVAQQSQAGRALLALARLAIVAGVTAAVLLGLHALTVVHEHATSVAGVATDAVRKTLLGTPWFPRIGYLATFLHWQPLYWLLMTLGLVVALARRRFDLASLALALLPIAFYRNAFPYYYVVMLAPACVLAGYAVQELTALVRRRTRPGVAAALVATIWVGLLYQGLAYAARLSQDGQSVQRELIAGVHEIFPEPVNYVDRCGMVSSFRKVNFFMSTWGLEAYRERGVPFMPAAMRDREPAFVIVNSWAMDPAQRRADGLLAEDYELIDRLYPPYWGPLRVAGASAGLSRDDETRLSVPFAADYRVASPARVLIDDVLRQAGDIVHVPTEGVRVRPADPQAQDGLRVTLFLAAARPPPAGGFPPLPLFTGL